MKILQIRGRNLASLAGDFELDFEHGPLADAGLFAIAGPTGAGKSTLLDALCLALYGKTPRFSARPSSYELPDGAEGSLGSNDPRSLLRRGTVEGFAEVRFEGADGQRYQARWSVRRARNKPHGRLQAQEYALTHEASGKSLARTKTEFDAAISSAVGLSFDQFRRSVLLAQGDFAAFLQASSDERSALLERMTGTELYGELSKRAHEKAKRLGDQLKLREQAAKAAPVLALEERAELEHTVATLTETVKANAARLATLRNQEAWWHKLAELQRRREEAQAQRAEAEQRWTEAAPRRQALDELERLQPLRALDRDLVRTSAAHTSALLRRDAAASALAAAQTRDREAAETLEQARAAREAQRTEEESLKPSIDRARTLDHALAEKQGRLADSEQKLAVLGAQLADAERASEALRAQRSERIEAQATLAQWLDEQSFAVTLAEGWSQGIEQQLKAFERDHQSVRELEASLPALRAALDAKHTELSHAKQEHARTEVAARTAQEQARATAATAAAHPGNALSERRTALDRARTVFDEAQRARDRALRADQQAREVEQKIERASSEAANAVTLAHKAAAERSALDQQLLDNERLRLQLGLDVHRSKLVEGEPCPLCGSCQHPGLPNLGESATANELVQQHDALLSRANQLRTEEARQLERSTAQAEHAEALQAELVLAQTEREAAVSAWREHGGDGEALHEAASAWLEAQRATLATEQTQLTELERELSELRKTAEDARTASEAANHEHEQVRAAREQAERVLAEAKAHLDQSSAERATKRVMCDAALEQLAPRFATLTGWRQELEADPAQFLAHHAAQVETARAKREAHQAHQQELATLASQLEVKSSELQSLTRQHQELQGECEQQRQELERVRQERQPLLDGAAVSEVEARLLTGAKASREALARADTEAKQTKQELAGHTEAHKQADQALLHADAESAAAKCALEQALQEHQLSHEALRAQLARDEDELRSERAALKELGELRAAATKLTEVTERELEQHRALTAPELPLEAVVAALRELEQRHDDESQQLGAHKQQLKADDESRAQGEARAKELEEERAKARVWQQLDELIGSGNGNKLRTFAQSLTLELLLAHANAELRSLAPRYVLQRVAQQDLDLQIIDRDMGDEIRSTASLSGGETFLVSLALALGLSSLASEKIRIQSLFIDEGFGSLDAQTLELAIATLDSLQSAGRKVGLISHVPGLAERIGVQIVVERQGNGASAMRVVGAR